MEKLEIFKKIEEKLNNDGFEIIAADQSRPWGGFFVLNEKDAQKFANQYFDGINIDELKIGGKLSPKMLIVAPNSKLSWQYHHRRAEIWQVVEGEVGIIRSDTDEEGELVTFKPKDQIKLKSGERHRLVGLENWGIVAEIWQHTDNNHPSDEDDIVRVQDDFGR